ncbi:carboxypeptidase-like regulatory domain-containing protein, partial [Reichenbachiella sp.]
MKKSLQILMLLVMPFLVHAQQISGTISDKNGPVIGATVSISSSNGTITNVNGNYELKVPAGTHEVSVSFVGYVTKKVSTTVAAGEKKSLNVTIEENVELLNELVVVGTRSRPRSSIDTAVPVDILDAKDLTSTGQNSFDKALTYRVPSFNSVQTPVN